MTDKDPCPRCGSAVLLPTTGDAVNLGECCGCGRRWPVNLASLNARLSEAVRTRDLALSEVAELRSERGALADRLAIAERAAREEREARIAAERRLEMLTVGAAARCKCDDDDSWCPCNCCGATTGEPCRHDPKTGLARALSGGKGEER